jgi:flagellar L-ring protein precursor FlgH
MVVMLATVATTGVAGSVAADESTSIGAPRTFYADRRAARPGDMLTVIVTEFSTVTATARTRTDKDESAQAKLLHSDAEPWTASAGIGSTFAGGGQIERSGQLLAKIAVVVREADGSGNLVVHGDQEIQVNNERQRIQLDGVVRAEDIEPDNTVPSWRIADARIELTGKGLLARKQAPGLLTRMLSWIWE